jgi:hypothetical protein
MEFTVKSKFNLGDTVWFMHKNKPIQGIIYDIHHRGEESTLILDKHEYTFNELESLLEHKRISSTLYYGLCITTSNGTFILCRDYKMENELFPTKEELLKSL